MTFLSIGGFIFDCDLDLLAETAEGDRRGARAKLDIDFDSDPDPAGSGLLARGDGLYGLRGFVACQQYLNVRYKDLAFSTDR